ncbi:MAG: DciA family protein [Moraxellaceae bacterium]
MAKRLEKPSALNEILATGALSTLRQHTERLQRLDAILGLYLDSHLRPQVQVAGYAEGILTLTCGNGSLAGQLRYLSRIYMQQLRQHAEFCALDRIRVVSGVARTTMPPARERTVPPLSAEVGALLTAAADSLAGGEVSEALRRLARHALTDGTKAIQKDRDIKS